VKIALITHNFCRGDGQSRVNYELAFHALRQGVQVTLFAAQVDPLLVEMGAACVSVRPGPHRTDLGQHRDFARRAHQALRAAGTCFDIVHANGSTLNAPHDVNTSHFVHGAWRRSPVHVARLRRDLYGAYQWTYTTLNAIAERSAYQKARLVVAVSDRVRQELLSIGLPENKVRVIINGVDLEEFHPGSATRSALGLPSKVPLALFVGDIRTPRKNLDSILRALVQVPALHLAIVGATETSPFPALAAALGVESRAHFLGFRKDIADIMRAADMFVFPSRYEACSLVLLEAMATGLPIVTAQTTGGAELIGKDCGVVLSDPDDLPALVQALHCLLDSPEQRQHMGENARRIAEQHSWGQMTQEYLHFYQELQ
jgi:glycosyltransferase involved in cell wall biosynthesis